MKLKVENLAKIKEAEVNVNNLTLFVGQNSTNKSYMAHVIYELHKYAQKILNHTGELINFTEKIYNGLLENDTLSLSHIVNITNVQNNETILNYNSDDITFKNIIEAIFDGIISNFVKSVNQSFNANKVLLNKVVFSKDIIVGLMNAQKILFNFSEKAFELKSIIDVLIFIIFSSMTEFLNRKYIHYFPASRSSYMLTLEPMYAGIFGGAVRGKSNISKLTDPTIDFIERFYEIKNSETKDITDNSIVKLIHFLETEIIKGKLVEERNELGHVTYYLESNNTKLDLQLTSSMTLEVLPFIIFLKDIEDIKKSFFVIEEPEAHLHPKAQIQMAKFIVMLVNSGAKVLVTTHSDYILGEINNCIKKYELKEDDISISKENVSAYLFKNLENETQVKELPIDKFGISDENFEEALDELLEESGDLTDRILENE